MSKFLKTLAIFALCVPVTASASSEQACRNAFNSSQASNHCYINSFISVSKPGRYWQCHMQVICDNGGFVASSGYQLNQLSSLHWCSDIYDTQYGSC